jgi:hypothetical protein
VLVKKIGNGCINEMVGCNGETRWVGNMIGLIELAGAGTARGRVRMKVASPESCLGRGFGKSDLFIFECAMNW